MSDEVKRYKSGRKRQAVEIEDDEGQVKKFWLIEMKGPQLDRWMEISAGRMKLNRKGRPTGKADMKEFHASLICLCLYEEDGKTPVTKEVIAGWGATLQNDLFMDCRKMNGLDDDSEEEEKND